MPSSTRHLQAIIFGGGIAGLWTLARLTREGYDCLLLTTEPLGAGQTIASQGIIHGGIKYTLGLAEIGDASRRIAEMPEIWRGCLEGRGQLDLTAARVLSPHQYLWTTPGLISRIAGFGASRAIRTEVVKLAAGGEGSEGGRPAVFAGAPRGVDVYRVEEPVLAVDSVVRALALPLADRIGYIDFPGDVRFETTEPFGLRAMELLGIGKARATVRLTADRFILAAGAGNQGLLNTMNPGGFALMQRRPLHMVIAQFGDGCERGKLALFAHCLGASSLPRLTITSAGTVWYIGGQIAEVGVGRSEADQIAAARAELAACLPWVNLGDVELSTFRIDRAEGVANHGEIGKRPDGPVITEINNVIVGSPTKLAFAPAFAEEVLGCMVAGNISPAASPDRASPPATRRTALDGVDLAHPGFAKYPWERA